LPGFDFPFNLSHSLLNIRQIGSANDFLLR